MVDFFKKILFELDDQLQFITSEFETHQKRAEESYAIISKAYEKLQAFVLKYKFRSEQEEINYFKIQKPKLIS